MLLSKESLLLRKFEFEYETEDEDAPQWDWNKLGSYLVPLYAIGRTTSLLGFPIQRPNQNEDSQTSNPFFPALTKSSPAAWSTPDGRSPPIRSRPGCEVTAGSQTWPARHGPTTRLIQRYPQSPWAPLFPWITSAFFFYLLPLQVNKTMAGD